MINFFCNNLVRRKIKNQFGGNLKAFVSGGGALDKEVGLFLNAIGLPTLQGYGLTETSPVQLRFIIETGDSTEQHVIAVKYPNITSPDPLWHRDDEYPKERICINIEVIENQSGNLTVSSNPFWSIENSSFLPEGEN